jgi:hypothetical protein
MQGIDAEYVSLESVVPPHDEIDGTLGQDFYDRVSDAFAERIRQCEPRVPVVTGSPRQAFLCDLKAQILCPQVFSVLCPARY